MENKTTIELIEFLNKLKDDDYKRGGKYGCDEDYYGSNNLAEILKLWNLTKPAHEQSDETLLAIIKILGDKN